MAAAMRAKERSVIVIGAGMAGLAAANRLRKSGFNNVKILESSDRIGGRAYTNILDVDSFIEMGAQWVHGEENNAVHKLAVQKDLVNYAPPGKETDQEIFRTDSGVLVDENHGDAVYEAGEKAFNEIRASDYTRYATVQDFMDSKLSEFTANNPSLDKELTQSLWRWSEAFHKSIEGCDSLKQMNLPSFSEYRICRGNQLGLLKRGFVSVVGSLANDIPKESVSLNQTVARINTNQGHGARVLTHDGVAYHADHVIITVSLGVLKARARDMFIPSLPTWKLEAFQAVGFGTVNKVFLQFESAFWEEDGWKSLGLVWTADQNSQSSWERGLFGFDGVNTAKNILCGWLTGEAARKMEEHTKEEIIYTCVEVLKRFTGRKSLPRVVAIHESRWFSDENFKGSYSFRTTESSKIAGLNKILSEPLYGMSPTGQKNCPTVMFAGEHTHAYYYSTVHGALESGEREANRLIKYYDDMPQVKSSL